MNRKTLVIAIGIIVAVCLGVHFYAQWDMKRFDASLPNPPAADIVVETPMETAAPEDTAEAETHGADEPSAGHWHGDEWHEEPHTAEPAPPAQPAQPVLPVVAEPQPVKELAPWLVEWRAALEHHKAESKRLREEGREISAEWEALKKARRENRISYEEYEQRFRVLHARQNTLTREMHERAAALQAAEAKRFEGGTNE